MGGCVAAGQTIIGVEVRRLEVPGFIAWRVRAAFGLTHIVRLGKSCQSLLNGRDFEHTSPNERTWS